MWITHKNTRVAVPAAVATFLVLAVAVAFARSVAPVSGPGANELPAVVTKRPLVAAAPVSAGLASRLGWHNGAVIAAPRVASPEVAAIAEQTPQLSTTGVSRPAANTAPQPSPPIISAPAPAPAEATPPPAESAKGGPTTEIVTPPVRENVQRRIVPQAAPTEKPDDHEKSSDWGAKKPSNSAHEATRH